MKLNNKVKIHTVPTLLMGHVKQWLAIAAFLASTGHIDSLQHTKEQAGIHYLLLQCWIQIVSVSHYIFWQKKSVTYEDRSWSYNYNYFLLKYKFKKFYLIFW